MIHQPRLHFTNTAKGAIAARRIRRGQGKGRPPPRRCPDDFDVIFVEIGRLDCENWYRASRRTINRWLEERGKSRLIDLRAAYVRHQRNQAAKGKVAPKRVEPVNDNRSIDPDLARLAADYLRIVRNGGWRISQAQAGDWRVGLNVRSAAELVALAERKGFDVAGANLQLRAQRRVG